MSLRGAAATKQTRDARLAELLRDSLALWQVQGTVEQRDDAFVVHAGVDVTVQRTDDGPFRWRVTYGQRKRPCGSVIGVLSALRGALNVERGAPLRIA